MSIRKSFKQLTGAAVAAMGITLSHGAAANVFAQEIVTATVPVTVSVAATVSITPPDDLPGAVGVSAEVPAGTTPTILTITLADGNTAVSHRAAARGFAPVAMTHSRGNVSLRLSPQQYGKATISLFAVNGRRVLSGKADAARAGLKLSRGNVAAGVYLLSVKGVQGNFHSNRIVHSGGRLNIDAAFDASGIAPVMARMTAGDEAEYGEWTITAQADGYSDMSYTFIPVAGTNDPQTITLEPEDIDLCADFTDGATRAHYGKNKPQFCDERDGNKYVYQTIGGKTWMAENLNYAAEDSKCYNNNPDNCAKYGRLYDWTTATLACPAGWRLPNNEDWETLFAAAGGVKVAGNHLKEASGWQPYEDTENLDTYGFAALPGGYGGGRDGPFSFIGTTGIWWSATEDTEYSDDEYEYVYWVGMYHYSEDVTISFIGKSSGFSVRCVRK